MLNLISGDLRARRGPDPPRRPGRHHVAGHLRARLGIGRTYQIPRPFAGMTVFENVLLGATFATVRRAARRDPTETAASTPWQRPGCSSGPTSPAGSLPLLDRKRLELARALATRPRLLLLDEIAGGLTEHEVADLVGDDPQLRAEGVTIIWIEHVVPALLSVVDRLIAIDFGRMLADGEPRDVMAEPRGPGRLPGRGGRRVRLLEIEDASSFYGDFQALFGVTLDVDGGRDGGDHRRQRRRQVHAAAR